MERLRLLIGSRHWLLLAALALTSLALGTAIFSGASFTSKSANSASLAAGSVKLSSSAGGAAIVSASGMKPGESKQGTISIGNQGDVEGSLSLSATGLSGSALANTLTLRIDDVTGSTVKKYEGKLGSFSSLSLGAVAPSATRKYQFTLIWPSGSTEAGLQGTSTTASLQWELDNGFTDTSQNSLSASAIADWTGPSVEASMIAPTSGGTPGYLKSSKPTYYVYAKVTDSGNPASGVSSVKANVENLTSGQSVVSLTAGSYTLGGVAYNYRSSSLTAGTLSGGGKGYSLTAIDKAGSTPTIEESSVMVLANFAAAAIETDNVDGGNEGKPEKGDTVTFTYVNPVLASSIVSGWSGESSVGVTATITQSSNNDKLEVSGANLGLVELKGNYVSKTVSFTGSTLRLEGNAVVLTLGSPSSSSSVEDDNANRAPTWKPSSSAKDLAENASSTSSVPGSSKKQF